jgi:hypothetical protein
VIKSKGQMPFYIELIEAMFSILVVMPMRKEVKHCLNYSKKTIRLYQESFGLKNIHECTWHCDDLD